MTDHLRALIEEMRTIALVAGQCSVEGDESTATLMAAAEAERCLRWADQIAVALAQEAEPPLTFDRFSAVNRERCESPDGFKHQLASWSTSDWFVAILGELGEAANVAKKLNRVRDGIPGNKESTDVLKNKLRQELGDAFVYLDLLAQALGFTIGAAAVEVFNAKSVEIGCPIRCEVPAVATSADTPHPQWLNYRIVHSSEIADDPAAFEGDYVPLEDVKSQMVAPEADTPHPNLERARRWLANWKDYHCAIYTPTPEMCAAQEIIESLVANIVAMQIEINGAESLRIASVCDLLNDKEMLRANCDDLYRQNSELRDKLSILVAPEAEPK